jgi:hypothetical protein
MEVKVFTTATGNPVDNDQVPATIENPAIVLAPDVYVMWRKSRTLMRRR